LAKKGHWQASHKKHLRTFTRAVNGVEFTFHAFTDARMIHVCGRGDGRPKSTGKPTADDSGGSIVNSLIGKLLKRGTVMPGEWEAA
jgi:hypothetical protein